MNKEEIQNLLEASGDLPWAREFSDFLKAEETSPLSADPGKYTVTDLQSEINVRTKSMEESGIEPLGFAELQNALSDLPKDHGIHNYVFKKGGETGIIYLHEGGEGVIGFAIIRGTDAR